MHRQILLYTFENLYHSFFIIIEVSQGPVEAKRKPLNHLGDHNFPRKNLVFIVCVLIQNM